MEGPEIRILIRDKLRDGRLPYDSMPRFRGSPGHGERCDACDRPISMDQLAMAGVSKVVNNTRSPFSFTSCASSYGITRGASVGPTHGGRNVMSTTTILIVILVLILIGALPTWPYSSGWGYYPSGGLGLILLIIIILALTGRL
jgi:hypothetical protein